MPELREVFEMSTRQVEPDADAWRQQEKRHRRASRNRRLGAYAVAAGVVAVGVMIGFRLVGDPQPGGEGRTAATPDPPKRTIALTQLVGVWFEEDGSHLLSIESDGSYALDDSGLLDTDPDDVGTVQIDEDGSIRLVSSEASRECAPGDVWGWGSAAIVLESPSRSAATRPPRLQVAEATASCSAAIQGSSSWGLAGSRSPLPDPVPSPDEVEGSPVAETDLIGFWVNERVGGLFRYSEDGTFAGYFPERLEGEPFLTGTWELRGRRIRYVLQSTRVPGCEPGDVEVLEAEVVEFDAGVALRTNVLETCAETPPPAVQVRLSPR